MQFQEGALGGDGEDTFVYRRKAESDTRKTDGIADFTSGQDALDFSGLSIAIDYVDIGGGFRGKAKDGTSIGTRTEDGDTIVLVDTDAYAPCLASRDRRRGRQSARRRARRDRRRC